MGQWIGAHGQSNVTKISETCLHCDITSRKPPTETKNIFFDVN